MNYKQLTEKKKVEIDILLAQGYSMRKVASTLGISHSTISRYKAGIYKKRSIDIHEKYQIFLDYLYNHYDRRTCSIEICIHKFKKSYFAKCPSVKQVYNWINEGKQEIEKNMLCYKKRRSRKTNGMMQHFQWNLDNKTVLPISLRPKYVEKRDEIGYNFILKNNIEVKSITVDNGLEFSALGLTAKKLGVKLYKCDPYCSFQRGTNERMNALVRKFIPKGYSLKTITQIHLDNISFEINFMPKKIFDFKSTFEIELNY